MKTDRNEKKYMLRRRDWRLQERKCAKEKCFLSEKGSQAPAPSLVQTGCLVWPALNNWNNIHTRRWMEGELDSVHLKSYENFPSCETSGVALLHLLLYSENSFHLQMFMRCVFSSVL